MKTLKVELPDKLAEALEAIVKTGWFQSEADVVRHALLEFVQGHRLELEERFQREDIAWAIGEKGKSE